MITLGLGGKRSGSGWMALCPAHDDRNPSLSLSNGDNGPLWFCHAGCSQDAVSAALREKGLFPSQSSNLVAPSSRSGFSTLDELAAWLARNAGATVSRVDLYSPDFAEIRIDNPNEKTYRPVHRSPNGTWKVGDLPGKLPLYQADQLPINPEIPVLVLEGPKCAAAARTLGFHATTSPHGAQSVRKADWTPLKDRREVVVWPDFDEPGRKYASDVRSILISLGVPREKIRILDPERFGLGTGEDIVDWIERHPGETPDLSGIPMIKNEAPNIGVDDPHPTDLGNCFRLVRRHGENIRYVGAWKKWLVWQGNHWEIDNAGNIERFAKDTALRIPEEIFGETERLMQTVDDTESEKIRKKIKEILGWAQKSEAENRLGAMINLAKTEAKIARDPEVFDNDPFLFGVKNGVIDLRTGQLIEPKRDQYITKNSGIEYRPGSEAPAWKTFLERIQPDPDVRSFLKRWCGYCLTGDTSEQCFAIFYGTGRNGKTTLVDTVMHILGTWARQADFQTFAVKDHDSISNDLARLAGCRLVSASEGADGVRLDEAEVKKLTGGDRITARFLHAEFFEYTPSFKIVLSTNHKPQIRGTDEGIWSRIRLVPFGITIPENERDPNLKKKLFVEAPGILNWMIDGCREWQQIGLGTPEAIKVATGEYRESSDLIGRWISERTVVTPKAEGTIKDLYQDFCSWTDEEGIVRAPAKKKFSEAITEKGFLKVRIGHKGMAGFREIGLIADFADSADPKTGKSLYEEVSIEKKPETASAGSAKSADLIDLDHPEEEGEN